MRSGPFSPKASGPLYDLNKIQFHGFKNKPSRQSLQMSWESGSCLKSRKSSDSPKSNPKHPNDKTKVQLSLKNSESNNSGFASNKVEMTLKTMQGHFRDKKNAVNDQIGFGFGSPLPSITPLNKEPMRRQGKQAFLQPLTRSPLPFHRKEQKKTLKPLIR